MIGSPVSKDAGEFEGIPHEWITLKSRIDRLPDAVRRELEPIMDEALEHARFRNRVLVVAKDALERLHLDLELARFDLDATRREKENLARRLSGDAEE